MTCARQVHSHIVLEWPSHVSHMCRGVCSAFLPVMRHNCLRQSWSLAAWLAEGCDTATHDVMRVVCRHAHSARRQHACPLAALHARSQSTCAQCAPAARMPLGSQAVIPSARHQESAGTNLEKAGCNANNCCGVETFQLEIWTPGVAWLNQA